MGFGCDCLRRDIFAFELRVAAVSAEISGRSPSVCRWSGAQQLAECDAATAASAQVATREMTRPRYFHTRHVTQLSV